MPPLERTLPLLDLHGLRKGEAIRAVTLFLETHESRYHHVQIITGTGSHSPHGPILRTAVENYLKRRQMDYVQDKPGSFRVKSGTGIVFYHQASCDVDTKVIVQDRQATHADESFNLTTALARSKATRSERTLLLQPLPTLSSTNHHPPIHLQAGPSLAEVAQSDAELAMAKEESLVYQRHDNSHRSHEQNEVNRALEKSLQQFDLEQAAEEEALQESIQQAMATSQTEALQLQQQEEELLQQALEQSAHECDELYVRQEQTEDELLRKAMEQSLQEATDHSTTNVDADDEEEERILQQVLQMSLQST